MSHEDPIDIAGNEKQAKKDEQRDSAVHQTKVDDFKWLMSTASGRRIVWDLLAVTGQYRSSFTSNRSLTDFNEGQRNVGLRYVSLINDHCLVEYVLMLKEQEHNGN